MENLKSYWTNYKNFIIGGVLFILLVVFWSYCTADSEINLPKAETRAANANAAVQESETQIKAADEASTRAEALEQPKREAIQKAANSRQKFEKSSQNFQAKKNEYEKFQSNSIIVSTDDLDERERNLLSDLDRLYPANR